MIRNLCACALFAVIGVRGGVTAETFADVETGFHAPPQSARPQTLWFWMNGNVSRDGITRDLEAMKRAGLAGAIMFDGGTYQPAGPVGYMEPLWREMLTHAVQEADRLGLTLGMHNAPGWSSTGGPWITPERSMKHLVWTETTISGPGRVSKVLAQPQTNMGFYRDALVIAFPSLPGEEQAYEDQISTIWKRPDWPLNKETLSDGNLATATSIGRDDRLYIEFKQLVEICGITVNMKSGSRFPAVDVECSMDGSRYQPVCRVASSGRHSIEAPAIANFEPVRARFFRLAPRGPCELAEAVLHRTPRIEDWTFKGNFTFRLGAQVKVPTDAAPVPAIDPSTVIDLTSMVDAEGRLRWVAPSGSWTILRFGYTTTGKLNVSASAAGTGLECDKLDPDGVTFHFEQVQARLLEDFGPLAAKSFTAVEVDSYEAGMQNWTDRMPEAFTQRAGYSLVGYMPAMTGRIVGSRAASERFLFDLRSVQGEMMTDNYYGRLAELCHEKGLKFYVEGYGQGMFDELHVSGLPDFPMTEFWTRTPWTPNRVVKVVASAAHIYGKPIVAAESFTGEEYTSRWLDYPYSLKALGDDMFALGLNQMIFHRFAHQPHPDAFPGMAMGPWGFHYDRTNTWFAQSTAWIDYLARCQHVLRQGSYVADVLYFVGERPPTLAQMAMPLMPPGYNFDHVDAQVLLGRATAKDGCIVLPEGGRYHVLLLPPGLEGMTPDLARKLRDFAKEGVTIIGPKPRYSLTLRGGDEGDAEVRHIADELWNESAERPFRVYAERSLADVLAEIGVAPDMQFVGREPDAALSWIHRKLPEGDVYFVSNRQRRVEEVVCSFRVTGRQPEVWNPETGEVTRLAVFREEGGRTFVPVRFDPSGSVFIVFRQAAETPSIPWVQKDGARVVDATLAAPRTIPTAENNFTMAAWAKPDTELRVMPLEATTGWIDEIGKFYLVSADNGDERFGAGHATAGLAVGRNGAFVIERSSTKAPAVLVAEMSIAGWTHVAVVYRDGKPSLYVNGKLAREGLKSGSIVHPGIGAPPPTPEMVFHFAGLDALARQSNLPSPPSQGRAFYFEGNFTNPELFDHAMSPAEVAALAWKPMPAPWGTPDIDVTVGPDGAVEALAWTTGMYSLPGGASFDARVTPAAEVGGPWKVAFQAGRGAPPEVTLPSPISWTDHSDEGVRYFSGTARYTTNLNVPAGYLEPDKRVVLDLGRVEVLASVRVNGKYVGLVWKEPYRIDVTEAVRTGSNTLELFVTNLMANRMIGDEQLPPENEYATGNEHGILKMPDWYMQGLPKPAGGRLTFTTWHFFDKDEPLLDSGLLGPVMLLNPVRGTFKK